MSECRVCKTNGKAGIQITFSDKIRSQYSQKMIPLELDKKTKHKHFESTTTTKLPEPNDYPNPITQPANPDTPKVDLNNLNVIRVIAAALEEYIAMKEA